MQLDNSKLTLKMQVGYFILQWRYKDYVSESLYFSRINKGFCLSSNKGNNDNAAFTFQAKRASFYRHSEISVLYFAFIRLFARYD